MKKFIYVFAIVFVSAFAAEANHNDVAVEEDVFATYTGRCLDGYTFTFTADNRDEAQGYVNGYCAARRELAEN